MNVAHGNPGITGDIRTADIPAVRMQGITKNFGANRALNNVDFSVCRGEIHALLGENGAGKSTLMHVLTGLTAPDAGTIEINGYTARITSPAISRRLGIAMVHQHFALAPALTVAENLALDIPCPPSSGISKCLNYSPLREAGSALSCAADLGWKMDPHARVSSLSVGEQQRIEIVKALATDADVLIFDEPTAVLIGDEISELFEVLRKLADRGKAIVLIAHKLSEILAVSSRVTVLRRGERIAEAHTQHVTAVELASWMVGDAAEVASRPFSADLENSSQCPPPELICDADNITVLGNRGETAIHGLQLQAKAGEIFGIGGVDGNGQTELAEALVGLRKVSAGSLTINAKRTGYIPQDRRRAGLAVSMSVSDNLLFDAALLQEYKRGPFLKVRSLLELSADLIDKFDIRTSSAKAPASALSGGNQQKIVVARALLGDPDFLVAVNPTRGLDIGAARFVHEQLIAARARGAAVVVISTDLDELAAISDHTSILAGGTLLPYTAGKTRSSELGLLLGGVAGKRESSDAN